MAIDTQDKRASASHMPWMVIAPLKDGSVDDADRVQISGYYAGITIVGDTGHGVIGIGLLLRVYK